MCICSSIISFGRCVRDERDCVQSVCVQSRDHRWHFRSAAFVSFIVFQPYKHFPFFHSRFRLSWTIEYIVFLYYGAHKIVWYTCEWWMINVMANVSMYNSYIHFVNKFELPVLVVVCMNIWHFIRIFQLQYVNGSQNSIRSNVIWWAAERKWQRQRHRIGCLNWIWSVENELKSFSMFGVFWVIRRDVLRHN